MQTTMKAFPIFIILLLLNSFSCEADKNETIQKKEFPIVIDHTSTNIYSIPNEFITTAKQNLIIAYGHTSHGSQITSGMDELDQFMTGKGYDKGFFDYSRDGQNNTLQLRDSPFENAYDLGNPDRSEWATASRNYLNNNPEVNVILWSWCGQVSWASTSEIDEYLSLMNQLETDFPDVQFVYITGHLDGSGEEGQLNKNNNRIREYCLKNNKILYDFADIESYDPNGETNYMKLFANDNCDYVTTENGNRNWAIDWQESHTEGVYWFQCSAAHSQALVGNLKAYSAWWLFARLAGWTPGQSTSVKNPYSEAADLKVDIIENTLHFKFNPDQKIVRTKLFNVNGQTIFSEENTSFDHQTGIDLNKISGIVLYEVITNKQRNYTGKVMLPAR